MPVSITRSGKKEAEYLVTFRYQPPIAGEHEVFLAGDFNGFDPARHPMPAANGIYSITLSLKQGKYLYKFVVNGLWLADEEAPEIAADGFGGHNSLIWVGDAAEIQSLHLAEFRFTPPSVDSQIFLSADFNGWRACRDRLETAGDGSYRLLVPLPIGRYEYKFLVNDAWQIDPGNSETCPDGFGGLNSVLQVTAEFPQITSPDDPPEIIHYGIVSEQLTEYLNQTDDQTFHFQVRAYRHNVTSLELWLEGRTLEIPLYGSNHDFDYYRLELKISSESFRFCFIYHQSQRRYFLLSGRMSSQLEKHRLFRYRREEYQRFTTPDWVKDGIIYQIFPDRFYNGDPGTNPDFSEWYYTGMTSPPEAGRQLQKNQKYYHFVKDWYDITALRNNPLHPEGKPDINSFYGGDLQGIKRKIPYLIDLGITIIYLNPVFPARSNHKYDAADFMSVDPHFGTKEDFREMVRECHAAGIRIILDVAFNHTGDTFWAFQDAMKRGPQSPYYSWYEWKQWPLPVEEEYYPSEYYSCWWGFAHMPELDYDRSRYSPFENPVYRIEDASPNQPVVNHILEVAEFWLTEMDIDGFRLDVPNEVPFWFWELFRKKVKSVKSDAYIVGEIWHNAREWVNGKYCDAVMNYACFKDPVLKFFNLRRGDAASFDRELKPGLLNYPVQATQVMMNLIDSHDTYRYLEIARGDLTRLQLAVLFQMTYTGVPHIWYGDEIGMMGAHDPDCRRPFNWRYIEDEDLVSLREFYKKLIRLRKTHDCLRRGLFRTVKTEGMLYAYTREFQDEGLLILINNGESARQVALTADFSSGSYRDLWTDTEITVQEGTLQLDLQPYSFLILEYQP